MLQTHTHRPRYYYVRVDLLQATRSIRVAGSILTTPSQHGCSAHRKRVGSRQGKGAAHSAHREPATTRQDWRRDQCHPLWAVWLRRAPDQLGWRLCRLHCLWYGQAAGLWPRGHWHGDGCWRGGDVFDGIELWSSSLLLFLVSVLLGEIVAD